jgi:hypothetical protein
MRRDEEDGTEGTGERHRWPRRRMLRWALGLAPAVAGGGWAAFKWWSEREEEEEEGYLAGVGWVRRKPRSERMGKEAWARQLAEEAGLYCLMGYSGASIKLDMALEADPTHAPARLLSACWYMKEDRWDLVQEDLAYIQDTPEGRLLLELTERRPRFPDWRHAFFESWEALGRPDFSQSTLLPAPLPWNFVFTYTEVWHWATDAQRFAMAMMNPLLWEPNLEWLLEQVRASDSLPLLVALFENLQGAEPEAPWTRALLPAVRERLGQLIGPSPRTLQLALIPFLAGASDSTPFTRQDLEVLEELVTLREWKQPASESFFLELRALFGELFLSPGHHALFLATLAQANSLGERLLRRAHASKAHLDEDAQRFMGRLLWEVGARLREQRSHQELDVGLRLQIFGSELTGHGPTRMDCLAMWVDLGHWEKALERAAYNRWPLAAMQEESCEPRARDEHVWMKAFAGKNALP